MIQIDNKFIFINAIRLSIENTLLIISSIDLFKLNQESFIIYNLYVSILLYWVYLICGYLKLSILICNKGKEFQQNIFFEIWIKSFLSQKIKKYIFIGYSLSNFILSIAFLIDINRSKYSPVINLLIFAITVLTFIKILILFCIGIFIIYNSWKKKTNEIIYEVYIDRNIVPKDDECSICLEKKDIEWTKLKCNHEFHYDCVEPWLRSHNTCPLCRITL